MNTTVQMNLAGVRPAAGAFAARISKVINKLSSAAVAAVKAHARRVVIAAGVPAAILFAGRFSATGGTPDLAALAVSSLSVLIAVGTALRDSE